MKPIFFAATRSFWLGVVPLLAILADVLAQVLTVLSDADVGPPVAGVIASLFGGDAAKVEAVMRTMAPVFGLLIAHQRSGASRPYTIRADAKTLQ